MPIEFQKILLQWKMENILRYQRTPNDRIALARLY